MSKIKLYHYVHCPFCIRVRLCLSLLGIDYISIVLPYDDELTPVQLTGVKMLPIAEIDGKYVNESLDIIKILDKDNILNWGNYEKNEKEVGLLLKEIGDAVHPLAMPYWIYTPEFDDTSRSYFQTKKEKKRGDFNLLVKSKDYYITDLLSKLNSLKKFLSPYFLSSDIGLIDLMIYSHLVGLNVVPSFRFPIFFDDYMRNIEKLSSFDYHVDFWQTNTPFYKTIRDGK